MRGRKALPGRVRIHMKNRREVYFLGKPKDNSLAWPDPCHLSRTYRRNFMINRRFFVREFIAFGLSVAILLIACNSKSFAAVDLAEAKAAALRVFHKLDKDSDATLDRKEIGGRLSKKKFTKADPDHDGTLSKFEYLDLVEELFSAAGPDKDGTLTAQGLKSKAGRALLRLIQP